VSLGDGVYDFGVCGGWVFFDCFVGGGVDDCVEGYFGVFVVELG